jgi:hypothetical protein
MAVASRSTHTEVTFEPVDEVPTADETTEVRNSPSMRAWIAAQRAYSKRVEAKGLPPDEADRFYRALLQWKRRHPDKPIGVRKLGDKVYVWIPDEADGK